MDYVPMKKLSIIIPVYNEEKTIHKILDKVLTVNLINHIEKEIVLVNDCSSDNSESVLLEYINHHPEQRFIYHKHLKTKERELHYITELLATGDYLVIQDADLEYDRMNTMICSDLCWMDLLMWFMDRDLWVADLIAFYFSGIQLAIRF